MTSTLPAYRIADATSPLWLGGAPWAETLTPISLDHGQTSADAVAAAGLGWRVEQRPLEAVSELGERRAVRSHVANVRSDTGALLGVVGRDYVPAQNADALGLADAITDSGRAHWLGAGATRGGARIHALMRLDREIHIAGTSDEDVLPLLHLRNGHDGGQALAISVAPFRLACLNGMLLPIAGAQRTWKARHTLNLHQRLADARRALGIAWRYYDRVEELGAELVATPLSDAGFDRFLAGLIPLPAAGAPDHSPRRAQRAERVRDAIRAQRDADDLANVRGTAWGALQAVTAYTTHAAPLRATQARSRRDARFERATSAAPLVDRAVSLLAEVER